MFSTFLPQTAFYTTLNVFSYLMLSKTVYDLCKIPFVTIIYYQRIIHLCIVMLHNASCRYIFLCAV